MRVLLISANTEKINMTTLPLGLACVAAATQKAGHDVAMVDLMVEKDTQSVLQETIEGFRPDVIGISVRNIDDQKMENPRFLLDPVKEIVARCRSLSRARIVLGGAGYSIFPEGALSFLGADMGIQGEGEVVFPDLDRPDGAGDRAFGDIRVFICPAGAFRVKECLRKIWILCLFPIRPLVFTISKRRTLDAGSDQTRMSLEL